ncbi:MAG TPA: GSCFA domain-containing protein [Flavobacterium sp.]|nr:GSCFA domain-containing protein [Flavobacterium sp.]
MQFRTQIHIPKSSQLIDYNSKIVSLGSCFAENMNEKLDYFKFQNTCNPFGIIFNPVSIEKIINRVVNQELFTEKDIFFNHERWHCFDVHSDLSNLDKEELITNLNSILKFTKVQLKEATHIIFTYGTSWVYRNNTTNEIVANCHKVAQKEFSKEILSVETIQQSIQNTIELIQSLNPNCKFIFTVSPVRHIKDGFVENQLSKAHLITAIHQTINQKPQITTYFPSYEILMDELRDYRFYASDMLHPNQVAIEYIWERFVETNINEDIYPDMEEVNSIQKGLAHRPFNHNSESHQLFLSKLRDKIFTLQLNYPEIKF